MAIPGLNPELPLRAKVRVGQKNEKGYPMALAHFVCDDPEFHTLAGTAPKTLRIRFPYATVEECFPTGLEKWMRSRAGNPILGCYSKGDGVAHRLGNERAENGDVILDPRGDRNEMPCRDRACPYYGPGDDQGCRPQARLNFFIEGSANRHEVFRWESKSLNSMEAIGAVLGQYPDLRAPLFELYAERRKQGAKQFTVVGIREVFLTDDGDVVALAPLNDVRPARRAIKALLQEHDAWPMTDEQIEWVKKVGPEKALARLQKKYAA